MESVTIYFEVLNLLSSTEGLTWATVTSATMTAAEESNEVRFHELP
jgi:hypothetical protein